jgi:DNA-directed RNA polymerase subunit M/transcription elongation factor TFIIS
MEFCEQCGSLIRSAKQGILQCSCGHAQTATKKNITEAIVPQKEIIVVDRQINPLATYEHACPKCGYPKAEILTKGTIVTDEDEFFLYKCGKCGFIETAEGLKVT